MTEHQRLTMGLPEPRGDVDPGPDELEIIAECCLDAARTMFPGPEQDLALLTHRLALYVLSLWKEPHDS